MTFKQEAVLAAANRSSSCWNRVELGCDTVNTVKSFCNASPKSVREVLNPWSRHVQISWLVSLHIGSAH